MDTVVTKPRKIHLAHGDADCREVIETMLKSMNHQVLLSTGSATELIERSVMGDADVIIASPHLRDMDGIDALIRIGERNPTPSIVVSRSSDIDQVERAMEDHVMAYLVEPVTEDLLMPSIYLAERRFQYFETLRGKIRDLEMQLESRKLIERAKGKIMELQRLSETDAHRWLQETARRTRSKLVDVAQQILTDGVLSESSID